MDDRTAELRKVIWDLAISQRPDSIDALIDEWLTTCPQKPDEFLFVYRRHAFALRTALRHGLYPTRVCTLDMGRPSGQGTGAGRVLVSSLIPKPRMLPVVGPVRTQIRLPAGFSSGNAAPEHFELIGDKIWRLIGGVSI